MQFHPQYQGFQQLYSKYRRRGLEILAFPCDQFGHQERNPFLPLAGDGMMQRDCSEQTARDIDEEVKQILDNAYAQSKQILQQHRAQLDLVAGELLKSETLDADTFHKLINQPTLVPA